MAVQIRSLLDSEKHILGDFNPDYFCEKASDGSPFNSSHFIYLDGDFIGIVFRLTEEEPWQYKVRGEAAKRDCFEGFDEAVAALSVEFKRNWDKWAEWVNNPKAGEQYMTASAKEQAEKAKERRQKSKTKEAKVA